MLEDFRDQRTCNAAKRTYSAWRRCAFLSDKRLVAAGLARVALRARLRGPVGWMASTWRRIQRVGLGVFNDLAELK
jgi:uncharacterized membrane protein YidH (DUF202 family)